MTTERIKEIQSQTAHPNSVSVQQALLQVWNEVAQKYETFNKKEMEKQAITQALNDGKGMALGTIENKSLEQYYNETFNTKDE